MRLQLFLQGALLAPLCLGMVLRPDYTPSLRLPVARPTAPRCRVSPYRVGSLMQGDVDDALREANLKAHISLWDTRRSMARATLSVAKAVQGTRRFFATSSEGAGQGDSIADGKGALVVSAAALAVAAATIRLGGRAALMSCSPVTTKKQPLPKDLEAVDEPGAMLRSNNRCAADSAMLVAEYEQTSKQFLTDPTSKAVLVSRFSRLQVSAFDSNTLIRSCDQATNAKHGLGRARRNYIAVDQHSDVPRVLGLDFADDVGMRENLDSFLAFFDGLGAIRYVYFLGGWVIAKTFCLDFLSIVLALGSGVVFGGVLQGALVSTLCATLASGLGFQLARTSLQPQVKEQLEKRPALRALEKVVSEEGFKTVITLRLAPVLPIPLGAYNYVYGATSLPLPIFLSGMFIGSIKPYLLDSYLGVFGKSLVDGNAGEGGDLALVVTFFVVVLVGTFASQVASRTWEELNAEAEKSLASAGGRGASNGRPGAVDGSMLDSDSDGLEWTELWGIERSSLPTWWTSWQEKDNAVRNKIRTVVNEEWSYMRHREDAAERGGSKDSLPFESRLPPPGPPLLDATERYFDVGAYIGESTVFPFVLMESFWKYSDPNLAAVDAGSSREDNRGAVKDDRGRSR